MYRIIYRKAYKTILAINHTKKTRGQLLNLLIKLDEALAQMQTIELETTIREIEKQENSDNEIQKEKLRGLAYPTPIEIPEPGNDPISEKRVKCMLENLVIIKNTVDRRVDIKKYGLLGIAVLFYIICLV